MTQITAAEARRLAGPSVEDRVNEVFDLIRERATAGYHVLNLKDDFWTREAYSQTEAYKAAVKQLTSAGFAVRFFYEEHQFVDMYTVVEW